MSPDVNQWKKESLEETDAISSGNLGDERLEHVKDALSSVDYETEEQASEVEAEQDTSKAIPLKRLSWSRARAPGGKFTRTKDLSDKLIEHNMGNTE